MINWHQILLCHHFVDHLVLVLFILFHFIHLFVSFSCFFCKTVSTTMENSMGQIVPMTSLALSQSMDSVNTATNEEEVGRAFTSLSWSQCVIVSTRQFVETAFIRVMWNLISMQKNNPHVVWMRSSESVCVCVACVCDTKKMCIVQKWRMCSKWESSRNEEKKSFVKHIEMFQESAKKNNQLF